MGSLGVIHREGLKPGHSSLTSFTSHVSSPPRALLFQVPTKKTSTLAFLLHLHFHGLNHSSTKSNKYHKIPNFPITPLGSPTSSSHQLKVSLQPSKKKQSQPCCYTFKSRPRRQLFQFCILSSISYLRHEITNSHIIKIL